MPSHNTVSPNPRELKRSPFEWLKKVTDVNVSDPRDKRRGATLNAILLGCGAIAILSIFANMLGDYLGIYTSDDVEYAYLIASMIAIGCAAIYFFCKNHQVNLASILFLVFMTLILFFGDDLAETIRGRNMIMMVIPILMAGLLLRPVASFYVAIAISILSLVAATFTDVEANFFGVFGYIGVAFISFLTTRQLEKVLHEYEGINVELDDRVAQRTQELRQTNLHLEREIFEKESVQRELRQSNKHLQEANARLQAINVDHNEFLTAVLEELRAPRPATLKEIESLLNESDGPLNEAQREKLNQALSAVRKQNHLLNNLIHLINIQTSMGDQSGRSAPDKE